MEINLGLQVLQVSLESVYSDEKISTKNVLYARVDLLMSENGSERYLSEIELIGKANYQNVLLNIFIEPELFFRFSTAASQKMADNIFSLLTC